MMNINRKLLITFILGNKLALILFFFLIGSTQRVNFQSDLTTVNTSDVLGSYAPTRTKLVVDSYMSRLSSREKIGQIFMITVPSYELTPNDIDFLKTNNIGGIVLMNGNIDAPSQVTTLTDQIQAAPIISPFIAVDQEGGTVWRVGWYEAAYVSQYEVGVQGTEEYGSAYAQLHANELRDVGINTNLAPVLDTCSKDHIFLTTRCFSDDPDTVSRVGVSEIKTYKDLSIISTAKHFPGHGGSEIDSHLDLPIVLLTLNNLESSDLKPFIDAIDADVPFVMTSHVYFPNIDSDYPASLSPVIQTDILRNKLGYRNIIISDDIRMEALANYPDRHILALKAGSDLIITTHSYEEIEKMIDDIDLMVQNNTISKDTIDLSMQRILTIKCDYHILPECV